MSEADWWLCDWCASLNHLAARRCYSCRHRKPRRAPRASQVLGYVATVSWDRKVTFAGAPSLADLEIEGGQRSPPPVREPPPRSVTAIAPRVPYGVRMTYRPAEVSLFPRARVPSSDPASLRVRVVGRRTGSDPHPGRPQRLVAIDVVTGERPRLAEIPIESPVPHEAPIQSHELAAAPGPPSHWRDLLDVPKPDARRLRQAFSSNAHRPRLRTAVSWPLGQKA
jgi:hypothetical protein